MLFAEEGAPLAALGERSAELHRWLPLLFFIMIFPWLFICVSGVPTPPNDWDSFREFFFPVPVLELPNTLGVPALPPFSESTWFWF